VKRTRIKPSTVPNTLRYRARRWYPVLSDCQRCLVAKATQRHHKDGDIQNNTAENIGFLCRACHIAIHDEERPPCSECNRKLKPLRKGLCHNCYERKRNQAKKAHNA
jgi:hypothetical protein